MAKKKKKSKKKVVKRKAAGRKTAKRKPAKRKKVVKKAAKKKKKRKLNPALMRSFAASDKLASVVGAKKITRQQAIKKIWDYVKKHKLQDTRNRRNINLDDKLKQLFGNKRQVTMFDVPKAVSKNLS